jgi:hypothetical protein
MKKECTPEEWRVHFQRESLLMSKTFILGAGFSADHQFPLVWGLKERVIHFLEAERHSSYRSFIEPRDGFPNGLFYEGLAHLDPGKSLGFEELLIALAEKKKQGKKCGPCSIVGKVIRIGAARLLWCMTYFIWEVHVAYANFATRLAENEWNVITFNWDILVEKALEQVGASWSYSTRMGSGSVAIIKPHGSINWSSFAQNPNLSAEYPDWKSIAPDSTLSFDSANPLANPDMQEINPDLRYCLYPGDPDYPEFHADLDRLWSETESLLVKSETVVFIGYSLPAYDAFTGEFLRRTCARKTIEVYDPSQTTLNAFASAFPHASLHQVQFRSSPYAAKVPT